jgi:hypothetical protein
MSDKFGRNDLCPCGSGKKYKKCCLAPDRRRAFASVPSLARRSLSPVAAMANYRSASAVLDYEPNEQYEDDSPESPDPDLAEVLPVEIGLKYTYPEQFGIAEVTHLLPAGRLYQLADGREIVNDDLEPGMKVVLQDGAIGTISAVQRYYEPPDLPLQVGPGLYMGRVIGTIRHRGISTIDISWIGNKVTGSTDHKFYSVHRGGYVAAAELRVGEILQGEYGQHVTITSVGERKLGLIDLYNIEVEQFHNYHVGEGPSVLVHNGATDSGGYINKPADKGPARRIIISKGMQTLDLNGQWRKAKFTQQGIVYVLRDKRTGELLKVGQTTSKKFIGRFEKYVTAGKRNGRDLALDVFEVPLGKRGLVEGQIRGNLGAKPGSLPWDNQNGRFGRPGPGVP